MLINHSQHHPQSNQYQGSFTQIQPIGGATNFVVSSVSVPTSFGSLSGQLVQETVGYKTYEYTNLPKAIGIGNVLLTTNDKRLPVDNNTDNIIDGYAADVKSYADYYPYGMAMVGRNANISDYRFGMNGMEMDNEVSGNGNSYTTHFRQYDPRLGRWTSRDPITHPWLSPYNAFDGNPIYYADPSGADGEGKSGDGYKFKDAGGGMKVSENSDGGCKCSFVDDGGNIFEAPGLGEESRATDYIGGYDYNAETPKIKAYPETENLNPGGNELAVYREGQGISSSGEVFDTREQRYKDWFDVYGNLDFDNGQVMPPRNPFWDLLLGQRIVEAKAGYTVYANADGYMEIGPIIGIAYFAGDVGPLKPLGLGSTGRTVARSTSEIWAMHFVKNNPLLGEVIMRNMNDKRWSGWTKMQYVHEPIDGSRKVTIHFVAKFENGVLKAVDDFKFK